jgi:hypothetical protein
VRKEAHTKRSKIVWPTGEVSSVLLLRREILEQLEAQLADFLWKSAGIELRDERLAASSREPFELPDRGSIGGLHEFDRDAVGQDDLASRRSTGCDRAERGKDRFP